MTAPLTVIIVTYNSQKHIPKAIECLKKQTLKPSQVLLVDTGSEELSYLEAYRHIPGYKVLQAEKNSGFCRGNNVGLSAADPSSQYVFFLNPDAFLAENFLEKAIDFMEKPEHSRCGAITGTTLGYDIHADKPTGKYDTTGVFQNWYGRWFDRAQGNPYKAKLFQNVEAIPAICGAVFLVRKNALETVKLKDNAIFDPAFYMYKEDIDLSLRLRRKGWTLCFVPELVAYHCRGWSQDRSKMPRKMRLASARNELKIHVKAKQPLAAAYSLIKYSTVKLWDL